MGKRRTGRSLSVVVAFFLVFSASGQVCGSSKEAYRASHSQYIIGAIRQHVLEKEETLLDVARRYDLGFNEIQDVYPDWDPWLPPRGAAITIPSQWIVPEDMPDGILINTAELRLYYYDEKNGRVITFPIGIGDRQFPTPEGEFRIAAKIVHPSWTVPPSLRGKYDVWTVPPGPDNPLGNYWLGLGESGYGIHGTNFPWSIGRLASQGCIRLYPEDIRMLFGLVDTGTKVKIIYQPIKVIKKSGQIFVEVHKDVYGKIGSLRGYALSRMQVEKVIDLIDIEKLDELLQRQDGMPANITRALGSGF